MSSFSRGVPNDYDRRQMGVVNLTVLACVLRTTTKKGNQLFEEKSASSEKILATTL